MQKILVLGAGKSSGALLEYLASHADALAYSVLVADANEENLKSKVLNYSSIETLCADLRNKEELASLVSNATLVISLLPPALHVGVAQLCIAAKKPFFTASYATPEVKAMDTNAKESGVLLLMECGLDPGLDHMSSLRLIHRLKREGATITGFSSYCGGLIAPESDTNPWGYKITWNPRNVVLAGQGTAQFLEGGKVKYVPYNELFKRAVPLDFIGYGSYEAYPNRDSISYIEQYGLLGIQDFIRGTIRKRGFCAAWQLIANLGLADDTIHMHGASNMTVKEWVEKFLPSNTTLKDHLNLKETDESWKKLLWLGLEGTRKPCPKKVATSAEYLQSLLEEMWVLEPMDRDLILMQHRIDADLQGSRRTFHSSLVLEGTDSEHTAMAKTVGLPLGAAALLYLRGDLQLTGVQVPVIEELYRPILDEMEKFGIIFRE